MAMNSEQSNLFSSEVRRYFFKVLTSVFLTMAVSGLAAERSSEDDENADPRGLRFISPDGKFGLLVTDDPEGSDRVGLVEVATQRSLVVLSDPERPEISSKARLDWSKDSKKVAAYIGTRVDGYTRIFAREGDGFVEVELPDLPRLPNPEEPSAEFRKKHQFKFLKWIDAGSLQFVRWLESGDLAMRSSNEVATVDGKVFRAEINATITIDAKQHATLKKVERKESLE
jgi:hypothetical protein